MLDVYVIAESEQAQKKALLLSEIIRASVPNLKVMMNCGGGSFKSQFKRADKSGATFALVLGDNEIQTNTVTMKYLRSDEPQQTKPVDEIIQFLKDHK